MVKAEVDRILGTGIVNDGGKPNDQNSRKAAWETLASYATGGNISEEAKNAALDTISSGSQSYRASLSTALDSARGGNEYSQDLITRGAENGSLTETELKQAETEGYFAPGNGGTNGETGIDGSQEGQITTMST
jgi:hypothetical protein